MKPSSLTVRAGLSVEVLNRFYAYVDVSVASLKSYKSGIRQFMNFLSTREVRQPNRTTVLEYKNWLMSKGIKAASIALYLSSLRRLFSWLSSEGIYADITSGIKSPKQDYGHKREALSGMQVRECVKELDGSGKSELALRNKAMFLLMSCCGLRTIEVVRADVSDLRTLQGQECLYVQGKGKSSKTEFVKLTGPVLEAIREYLAIRGETEQTAPLFVSCSSRNRGSRLTTRTVSGLAKSTMVRAGYSSSRLTAHSLRHTAATLAVLSGMSIQEVQHFLRHSSINVTMLYVHDVERLKSRCETAVVSAIFG